VSIVFNGPRYELAIFDGPAGSAPSAADVAILHVMLDALVRANVVHFRSRRLPRVADAARRGLVRYVDPRNKEDPWRDWPRTLASGEGDCEDIASAYVADLIVNEGRTDARCGFTIESIPGDVVPFRVHIFARVGRAIVDPSRWFGMR
jgi:hypothetical protein